MVMVIDWAPERAVPLPGAPGAGVLPGQPRQAVRRVTAARSARRTGGRIGAGKHATGEVPGSTTFVRQVTTTPGSSSRIRPRPGRGGGVASTRLTTGEG